MKLYGVYHANGGILGELAYVAGRLMGTTHCALCDITHGAIATKKEFKSCVARLPVPLFNCHLNEQTPGLKNFTQGKTPCVVLQKDDSFFMALDADALDACGGDVVLFENRLVTFLQEHL